MFHFTIRDVLWLMAAFFLVGCGTQSAKPQMVEVNKLQPGPIRYSALTEGQMARIEQLQIIFSEVSPQPLEKWVDDFKRDVHPDNEIAVWESMATAYQTFVVSKNLPLDGKKRLLAWFCCAQPRPKRKFSKA